LVLGLLDVAKRVCPRNIRHGADALESAAAALRNHSPAKKRCIRPRATSARLLGT
jgi:hypothetical protein